MKTHFILLFLLIGFLYSEAQNSGVFTDRRDGQKYKWVKIGNQIWMAENLNYAAGRGSGMYREFYGHFYDWQTAKRVCPEGWHLPSDNEWLALEFFLGLSRSNNGDFDYYRQHEWNGGKILKSKTGWEFYVQNGNGTDSYGFNALPGGYYQTYNQRYMLYGSSITFWTSTGINQENAIVRTLGSDYDGISRDEIYKVHGAYCRCVKD
jgi:uncharacterized protein (TIGR02145 family)